VRDCSLGPKDSATRRDVRKKFCSIHCCEWENVRGDTGKARLSGQVHEEQRPTWRKRGTTTCEALNGNYCTETSSDASFARALPRPSVEIPMAASRHSRRTPDFPPLSQIPRRVPPLRFHSRTVVHQSMTRKIDISSALRTQRRPRINAEREAARSSQ